LRGLCVLGALGVRKCYVSDIAVTSKFATRES